MNRETAAKINDLLVQCHAELHGSIDVARAVCSDEENRMYCKAVGMVLGYMLLDLMDPIYREHPALTPDHLRP